MDRDIENSKIRLLAVTSEDVSRIVSLKFRLDIAISNYTASKACYASLVDIFQTRLTRLASEYVQQLELVACRSQSIETVTEILLITDWLKKVNHLYTARLNSLVNTIYLQLGVDLPSYDYSS